MSLGAPDCDGINSLFDLEVRMAAALIRGNGTPHSRLKKASELVEEMEMIKPGSGNYHRKLIRDIKSEESGCHIQPDTTLNGYSSSYDPSPTGQ